jgi:membrane protease YdiL (CAAX protease family)
MIVVVLLAANTIGAIPLMIALIKTALQNPEAATSFAQNPGDFSILGVDSNVGLAMMLLPFMASLFAFILLVKPIHGKPFTLVVNGTGKIRWKRFFTGAIVWLVLSGVYLFIFLRIDPANFTLNNTSGTLVTLIIVSLLLFPFQASMEEVLFRGYLMQGFAVLVRNKWFPLIVTSVLFGLMHAVNPEVKEFGFLTMMPHYIIFGLVFGIITILDDGIEVAMGAHSANNFFLSVMLTHKSSAMQTDAVYEQLSISPWLEFTGLVLMGIVFILILKKLLGWVNFNPLWSKIQPKQVESQSVN